MTIDNIRTVLAVPGGHKATEAAMEYMLALVNYHNLNPARNPELPPVITADWIKSEVDAYMAQYQIVKLNVDNVRTYLKAEDVLCPF